MPNGSQSHKNTAIPKDHAYRDKLTDFIKGFPKKFWKYFNLNRLEYSTSHVEILFKVFLETLVPILNIPKDRVFIHFYDMLRLLAEARTITKLYNFLITEFLVKNTVPFRCFWSFLKGQKVFTFRQKQIDTKCKAEVEFIAKRPTKKLLEVMLKSYPLAKAFYRLIYELMEESKFGSTYREYYSIDVSEINQG